MRRDHYSHAWLSGGGSGRRPRHPGYWVEWYDADPRRRNRRSFPTRELARTFAQRKTEQLNAALFGHVAWPDMISAYTAAIASLATATQVQYLSSLAQFAEFAGRPPAHQITPRTVQAFFSSFGASAKPETLHKHRRHLRAFFRFGVRQDPPWWSMDPARGVILPRPEQRLIRAPSVEDVAGLLLATARTPQPLAWYVCCRLAFETGLRENDLVGLQWSQLRYESVGDESPGLVLDVTAAKTRGEKLYCVTPALELALQALQDRPGAVPERVLGWISFQRKTWNRLRGAAGLRTMKFHDLRRSAGTFVAQMDASMRVAAGLLDHSTPGLTRRHYLDSLRRAQSAALLLSRAALPTWPEVLDAAPSDAADSARPATAAPPEGTRARAAAAGR